LQAKVREHIRIASELKQMIASEPDFELLAPVILSVVCFRYCPGGVGEDQLNRINEALNHKLNDSGRIYLTHTVLGGKYTLRMVTAQTNVTWEHVRKAWELIIETARSING
jgi:aromatic-L-amino-acid decarboxylase